MISLRTYLATALRRSSEGGLGWMQAMSLAVLSSALAHLSASRGLVTDAAFPGNSPFGGDGGETAHDSFSPITQTHSPKPLRLLLIKNTIWGVNLIAIDLRSKNLIRLRHWRNYEIENRIEGEAEYE